MILPSGRTYGIGYDANGNRTSITMPNGAVHGLGYTKINLDNTYVPPGNPVYSTSCSLDRVYFPLTFQTLWFYEVLELWGCPGYGNGRTFNGR